MRDSELTAYLQKPFFLLHILCNVNLVHGIIKTEFLEQDVDFLAIGRAGRVSDVDRLVIYLVVPDARIYAQINVCFRCHVHDVL